MKSLDKFKALNIVACLYADLYRQEPTNYNKRKWVNAIEAMERHLTDSMIPDVGEGFTEEQKPGDCIHDSLTLVGHTIDGERKHLDISQAGETIHRFDVGLSTEELETELLEMGYGFRDINNPRVAINPWGEFCYNALYHLHDCK